MRYSITTTTLLLAAVVAAGCWRAEKPTPTPPAAIQGPAVHKPAEADLAVLRYDTGEVINWPDYNLELQYSFDVPEVPPEIVGPFSADDIPAEE